MDWSMDPKHPRTYAQLPSSLLQEIKRSGAMFMRKVKNSESVLKDWMWAMAEEFLDHSGSELGMEGLQLRRMKVEEMMNGRQDDSSSLCVDTESAEVISLFFSSLLPYSSLCLHTGVYYVVQTMIMVMNLLKEEVVSRQASAVSALSDGSFSFCHGYDHDVGDSEFGAEEENEENVSTKALYSTNEEDARSRWDPRGKKVSLPSQKRR